MPKGYEEIRDKLINQGMPEEKAKREAAAIWNSKHKNNLVTRGSK